MISACRVIGLLTLAALAMSACEGNSSAGSNRASATSNSGAGPSGSPAASPNPPKVAIADAKSTPCLLVSLKEATTILGTGTDVAPQHADGSTHPASCLFATNLSGPGDVTSVSVELVPMSFDVAKVSYIYPPAPFTGLPRDAACGPSVLVDRSALVGEINDSESLLVSGNVPCTTLYQFAAVADSHLK